jgi:hypothetical protein
MSQHQIRAPHLNHLDYQIHYKSRQSYLPEPERRKKMFLPKSFLLLALSSVLLDEANCQKHVLTTGYSKMAYRYSFTDGHLVPML